MDPDMEPIPERENLDHRIQAYLRSSVGRRDTERVGPFLATFTRSNDNPFRNYAIPDDGVIPSPGEVAALASAYVRRARKPRLEYLPGIAPAVEEALLAGGFTVEGCLPLMTCTPGQEHDLAVPPGIELVLASGDDELLAAAIVQQEAYEGTLPGPEDVERLRTTVAAGGRVVLARAEASGEPAGAGLYSPPHDGVTEIAAIGVRVPFRRRGIAAALAVRLAKEAFKAGVTIAFLMAEHETEARIYVRAGYVARSEILFVSR
jgi:ribosomal protein S18 acetylase RimI-like enzyme